MVWSLLAMIIILGTALRISGIEWGVPHDPYWRNHYQDEAFVLGLLFKMGPDNLNPHYFINPTFHYYTLLFAVKAASAFGYLKPFRLPVLTNGIGQPDGMRMEDYARMYRVGRFLTVIESIILIYLVFLIGQNLYNKTVGLTAAAFTAVLPAMVFQSHFLVVDVPAVFWFTLAFWFLTTRVAPGFMRRWSIMAGMFIGIAVGVKYTNILLVLPLLYRIHQLTPEVRPFVRRIFNRYTVFTGLTALGFFFFTTPYALLSANEFLHGDVQGFGGIFGSRGMLFYNSYPANILTPFSLATLQSLQWPLALFAWLGLAYLCLKHRSSDILLLFFIVPFYLIMIYHASPHLRHILMVMPSLMVGAGVLIHDLFVSVKPKSLRPVIPAVSGLVFIYTFLFSLALVARMTRTDSRIECADWLKTNIPPDATIGVATYFPWNYTPPIETIFKPEKIALTGHNYYNLLASKCEYFVITEYEIRDFAYAREDKYTARKFVSGLFEQRDYKIIKEFKRDFMIFGIKFHPHYPNLDWNPVNPEIYVFQKR